MTIAANKPRTRAFEPNWLGRLGWLLLAVYIVYAGAQLGFSWQRFSEGLGQGGTFIARMFPPNFTRWELLASGIVESLQIAVLSTVVGITFTRCHMPLDWVDEVRVWLLLVLARHFMVHHWRTIAPPKYHRSVA